MWSQQDRTTFRRSDLHRLDRLPWQAVLAHRRNAGILNVLRIRCGLRHPSWLLLRSIIIPIRNPELLPEWLVPEVACFHRSREAPEVS